MKRKTSFRLTVAALVIIGAVTAIALSDYLTFTSSAAQPVYLKINDAVVTAEVASTPNQWEKGLGGRERLDAHNGMLFVFPWRRQYTFWMQGMQFPLDLLFIDDTQIVDIVENLPAPPIRGEIAEYTSTEKASRVLEVPAGWVTKNNVRRGDHMFMLAQ